jgi:ABC-type branched-subunit amino acid transport system substrate-binding protein
VARLRGLGLAFLFWAGHSACGDSGTPDGDAITVGLLLPFTGEASATSSNFERAVLYAADRINAGGGVRGRRVRIVSGDTHSDLRRSVASVQAIIAAGAVVVIGPESSEIAAEIAPILVEHQVVFLSPLVGAGNDKAVDCTHPWFRLAPSARSMGDALAKLVWAEHLSTTTVLYAAGAYNAALGNAASTRFTTLGGNVALTLEIDPNAQSYASAARQVIAADADSVVLATSPRTAALVVNEYFALSTRARRWFLSPLLKTELLIENVVPSTLEGALGVAPRIYDMTTAFRDAFKHRWQDDEPLEGAYFYYDAMGLLAFALQKAVREGEGKPDVTRLATAILDVAAAPGESVGWNEIESGLERLRAGDDVYYSGLTGPMLLESCGPRRLGATAIWQVEAGEIVARPE